MRRKCAAIGAMLLVGLSNTSAGAQEAAPPPDLAAPPPDGADACEKAIVAFDGVSGTVVKQPPTYMTTSDEVIACVTSTGAAGTRFRFETKVEDEPDPRRYEVTTLSGGPPGGAEGQKDQRDPEATPPFEAGHAPACANLLAYLDTPGRNVRPGARAALSAVCEAVRSSNTRLNAAMALLAGTEDLDTKSRALKRATRQSEYDPALATYQLAIRRARALKILIANKPTDLAAGGLNAIAGLFETAKENKPPPRDEKLENLAGLAASEVASAQEGWKEKAETPYGRMTVGLQRLFTTLLAVRDRIRGPALTRNLGRFPSGKRVTLTVYRASSFALDPPPVDGVQGVSPQAEAALATASFHVYRRTAIAVSLGVGVGGLVSDPGFQEFAPQVDSGGTNRVGSTRQDRFVTALFLLVSANLHPEVAPEATWTGPWISAGFSVTDPLKSWMPVGFSVEYGSAAMLTAGLYLGRTVALAQGLKLGDPLPAAATSVPTENRYVYGIMFVGSFDPPVLKSLISK
jgi:hypothetical protein